jgi:hypothetical protein
VSGTFMSQLPLTFESEEPTLPGIGPTSSTRLLQELEWDDGDEEGIFRRESDGSITKLPVENDESETSNLRREPFVFPRSLKIAWSVSFFFRWYDMWIGAFWDRKGRILYVCPLPMFGVKVTVPAGWFRRMIKHL